MTLQGALDMNIKQIKKGGDWGLKKFSVKKYAKQKVTDPDTRKKGGEK
jgi:hypothetical protein